MISLWDFFPIKLIQCEFYEEITLVENFVKFHNVLWFKAEKNWERQNTQYTKGFKHRFQVAFELLQFPWIVFYVRQKLLQRRICRQPHTEQFVMSTVWKKNLLTILFCQGSIHIWRQMFFGHFWPTYLPSSDTLLHKLI